MKTHIQNLFLMLAILAGVSEAGAQGTTAFTYQGRLINIDNGTPANGVYDFRFRIAVDANGNNFIGSSFLAGGLTVSNGLFATNLDFGANIFTGSNLWLQIEVRTNGAVAYATLNPLQ